MSDRNVFLLGREPGNEDQLTEMLAWLIEVVPEVGPALMQMALGKETDVDPLDISTETQRVIPGGRLDALLETSVVSLVIESKLGSTYGDDQLEKYIRWLSEQSGDGTKVLLTLTQRPEPWSQPALALADDLAVTPVSRLWEQFYTMLGELGAEGELPGTAKRLLDEFADMLNEEGLVPMKPLDSEELGYLWAESRGVIERLHQYFEASIQAIATGLNATREPRRGRAGVAWTYKDFRLIEVGGLVTVGVWSTDEDWTLTKGSEPRRAPVLFAALQNPEWEESDWEETAEFLEASPPSGWTTEPAGLWEQFPCIWRYLDDAVGDGSFDEQQAHLTAAVRDIRSWVTAAWQHALSRPLKSEAQ